jgi:hypothetical protein
MNEYKEEISRVRSGFITLVGILLIVVACIIIIWTVRVLINGEQQICEEKYDNVCYKVGCSAGGCSEAQIDCNSNNVDRRRQELIGTICRWEKK